MKLLSWIIGLPVAVVAVVFAVNNRQAVTLDLWPLPWTLDLPLFLMALLPLALGLVVGGSIAWLAGASARGQARGEARRAARLENRLKATERDLARLENSSNNEAKSLPPAA